MPELTQLYLLLKSAHLTTVALSLLLFGARWLGVLARAPWPMAPKVRHSSVVIDSLLLASGAALWILGNWHPWQQAWLGSKLAWLLLYVLLGSWALKRSRTWGGHLGSGLLALGVAAHMVGVALNKHPAGYFLHWGAAP